MYEYRATVLRVVDGDTVHADVDLGFDAHQLMTLRLAGINAPEHGTPEGEAATAALKELIYGPTLGHLANPPNVIHAVVMLHTFKDKREKFGRYLATLFTLTGVDINAAMIAGGHAVAYDGGKR